jgi:cytochrome P450
MSEKPLPTTFQLMGLDPATRDDPYPLLEDLQSRCPVHKDTLSNQFILTRYDDIKSVVNDRSLWRHPSRARLDSLFRQFANRMDERGPREGESILFMDDPDHARVRQPLTKAFYKRAARMRADVDTIVDEVLDGLATRAQFDVIDDYGIPIPILVIAKVLGVERERLQEFRAWSEGIILALHVMRSEEQTRQMIAADAALTAYFTQAMAERRRIPRDDLITDMVQLQAEGAPLNDAEIRINLAALLVGGNLTTTDLIGNGVLTLLRHPEQLAALRADPSLYVRKSVANHLNDITKNHAALVLDFVATWDRTDARTAWIVRHALRTLIKRGHPRALALLGAGAAPKLEAQFKVGPARLKLGGTLTLTTRLVSTHTRPQSLIVDYVVHYARPGGAAAEKVFKWKQLTLGPGETVVLSKRQVIRDFSTRRHHPGRHRVELQINGRRLADGQFSLSE